jgi:hypothetical protein
MTQRSLFPKDGLPARLTRDFEAFWKAYPPRRPNPRALAEAEFAKQVRAGADPAELARAAAAYAAELKQLGTSLEFAVHAATFLRQRRWRDYLAALAPSSAAAGARPVDTDHRLWPLLRGVMTDTEFVRWIQPLEVMALSVGMTAILIAPSRFHRDWVRQHHAVTLKGALRVRSLDIDIAEDIRP